MSEPRRWKDSPDAPVGMRELLGSARLSRPLDEQAFHRGERRVAKLTVAPAAVAVVSIWSKLAAAGAVGLAATAAVVAVEARRDAVPVVVASVAVPQAPLPTGPAGATLAASAPTASATEASVAVPSQVVVAEPIVTAAPIAIAPPKLAARSSIPSAVVPSSPEPVWVPEEPVRAKSSLSEELALLEDARSHMTRAPETALLRLAEHRARHPSGVLAVERDIMELDALRRTGHVQDARDRARAWLAREPNGIHAARVRAIVVTLE